MPASTIALEKFRVDMLATGYKKVLQRSWAPGAVVALPAHPIEAKA